MELLDGTELESKMEDEEKDKAIGWQERKEVEEKEMRGSDAIGESFCSYRQP